MDNELYELLAVNRNREELAAINSRNEKIGAQFGLSLTAEETKALIRCVIHSTSAGRIMPGH